MDLLARAERIAALELATETLNAELEVERGLLAEQLVVLSSGRPRWTVGDLRRLIGEGEALVP